MLKEDDLGAYEIDLPKDFDHKKFHENSRCGVGHFWLTCTEDLGDFKRYTGVMFAGGNSLNDWIRISIDLGKDYAYINAGQGQPMTKEQIAREAMKALGGLKLYKDAVEVL